MRTTVMQLKQALQALGGSEPSLKPIPRRQSTL